MAVVRSIILLNRLFKYTFLPSEWMSVLGGRNKWCSSVYITNKQSWSSALLEASILLPWAMVTLWLQVRVWLQGKLTTLHICIITVCGHACVDTRGELRRSQVSVPTLHGFRTWTQVIWLACQMLYPLSHLPAQQHHGELYLLALGLGSTLKNNGCQRSLSKDHIHKEPGSCLATLEAAVLIHLTVHWWMTQRQTGIQ